jgi:Holliday junction DNA helicase RuvA
MYDFIKATLVELQSDSVVLETASGIGYRVFTPLSLFFANPKIGSSLQLYLVPVYREDSHRLFGFISKDERSFFEKITAISGIGPKIGMSLIGHLSLDHLKGAIQTSNIKLIEQVPGIGKKTAERIIIEMKDKLHDSSKKKSAPLTVPEDVPIRNDAISALVNLGYNFERATKAIEKAIESCGNGAGLDQVIKNALQGIQK